MSRDHRLSPDKPYPSVGDVNFPKVVRNAALATVEQEIFPMLRSPAEMPSDQLAESSRLSTAENKTYTVHDPRNTGKPRPSTVRIDPEFAGLISPLQPDEYAQLEANIRENGIREPIVVWWDGTGLTGDVVLLDGHHRLAILAKIEAENVLPSRYLTAMVRPMDGSSIPDRDAALLWVNENQLGRRNLTDDQRAVVADSIRDRRSAIAKRERSAAANTARNSDSSLSAILTDKENPDPTPTQAPAKQDTRAEVAAEANVPVSKLRAVAALKKAAPEKVQAVRVGEISLRQATKEAKAAATPKPATQQQTPAEAVKAITACMDKLVRKMSTEDALSVYQQLGEELKQRISVECIA